MTCVECGAVATGDAEGWCAYRTDTTAEAELEDTSAGDVPLVVFYCPGCAEREFERE